jgi:hypothetical protein
VAISTNARHPLDKPPQLVQISGFRCVWCEKVQSAAETALLIRGCQTVICRAISLYGGARSSKQTEVQGKVELIITPTFTPRFDVNFGDREIGIKSV